MLHWAVLGCAGLYWSVLVCTRLNWAVVGCSRLYCGVMGCTGRSQQLISVYLAIFGMVTNNQPTEQPGDPRASLLLTSVRSLLQKMNKGTYIIMQGSVLCCACDDDNENN